MIGSLHCTNCHARSWHLAGIVAACRYEGVGGDLIKRFKYGRDRTLTPVLGDLLHHAMGDPRLAGKHFDALVPVPLHDLREREREFNQSALLAGRLSGRLGIPVAHLLRRTLPTAPQAGLDRAGRMRNLSGAFAIRKPLAEGASLLLIDDVTTTGATLDACAAVLREAGAAEVSAIVIARG
jgi:ComF family protein